MGGTFQVEDDEFRCTASSQINPPNVDIMPGIVETVLISCGYSSRSGGFGVSNARGVSTKPDFMVLDCGFPSENCAHCVNNIQQHAIFSRQNSSQRRIQ
jgi:hypothetical protein